MNNHQKSKPDQRKLTKVRGYPGIFKVSVWSTKERRYVDVQSTGKKQAKRYRAFRWVTKLGKRVQQTQRFFTVDEARNWRMEVDPEPPKAKPSSFTMRDLMEEWREWSKPPRFAQSTWEIYGKDVQHYKMLGDVPVEELTAEDVDQWLCFCIDPSYPRSSARVSFLREVKTLTTILNWYREYKNPKFQPPILRRHRKDCFFKAKPTKEDISLSVEDLERFLDRLKHHHRPIYYYLASFQALTGVRIGEACGLRWECVDLEKAKVEIKRICFWSWKSRKPFLREGTKTGEIRTVVIPPRLVELLREWKGSNGNEGLVFHIEGRPMSYPAIQNAYKKAYKALGLPVRATHVLRHTFASIYADQTNDIRSTQAALGHRDLRVTQHYAKVAERTQRRSVAKFELGQVKSADKLLPPEGANVFSLIQRRKK